MSGPNAPLNAKRSLRVINAESDVSDDCVEEEFAMHQNVYDTTSHACVLYAFFFNNSYLYFHFKGWLYRVQAAGTQAKHLSASQPRYANVL